MKRLVRLTVMTAFALLPAASLAQVSRGEELINRRDQARAAFLATPQAIYRHYCAPCHGESGEGEGSFWASELEPKPTDLTALVADKEYVLQIIRDGSDAHGKSNLCPPWGRTISPANQERLAQYVVSLRSDIPPPPAQPVVSTQPPTEPFPWLLVLVLLGEMVFLWRMFRPKKEVSNVVPQDSPLRG
ncbi:MAG: c-type cytochrome [Terriglobia bacterium]